MLSGLLLSSLILLVTLALARWLNVTTLSRSLAVGFLWLCLTLLFEFGFGGLVPGRNWEEMLDGYTFEDGNLWPLLPAVTFFAPLIARRIRKVE